MKITFLVSLYHLEIKEHLGRGEKLSDFTFIANDPSLINKIIPNQDTILGMGLMERRTLDENKVFIYSTEEVPDSTNPDSYLINLLFATQSFLTAIWLFKDNNVDFEQGYVFFNKEGKDGISSNFLNRANTLSTGKREKVILNRNELKDIRKFYRDWSDDVTNSKGKYREQDKKATKLLKENNRIEVALYHTSAARSAPDLGMKIAHYCSSLEALFSSSQAELAHQLSERLAFFIGSNNKDRYDIYRKTKQAYTIRSKVVHGSTIKESDLEKVEKAAIFCDESLRTVYRKIFSDMKIREIFSGKGDVLNDYMLNLIFGIEL